MVESAIMTGYDLGLHFLVCIFVGTGLGYGVDVWIGTLPLFLLLGIFIGFAAGLYKLWQALNQKR